MTIESSGPTIQTALFTSAELLSQPWISGLTQMVNASYLVMDKEKIKFSENKIRLRSDSELTEELGPNGFTAVAFVSSEPGCLEIVGTASMKPWKDDGLWRPYDEEESSDSSGEDTLNEKVDRIFQKHACPGDYELAVVALPPGPRFRGKGLAGRLIQICEDELLRRHSQGLKKGLPARIMIRVAKENAGEYWLKQGFKVVGSQRCPKGFWDAAEEFTMWAMLRELSPK
ncbi:uncharacterized protein N7469_008389 [Penicillium citrinum]|uniref:Uncharacterized protein n=2 Tax=Penicillium TaxID=5073 RepID=A0A9W9TJB4_PENCI|nr:uncharacterized protein N7469_008389 [Penicillium citrinum]KAJ5224886.1 hypothetical protein N7469_008389 [Penicillium citrinum]KAJ5575143.1 hypothetical protein N7450_009042 [Penicillium hetheringtonii]KAK5796408.1 hypothetical protein VI817_005693 [Penicillium citrinum]